MKSLFVVISETHRRPLLSTMNSESPESTQEPNPPQKTVKKSRKRPRAYSRSLRKGTKDQKTPQDASDPLPPPSDSTESQAVQHYATSKGAAGNVTKTQLSNELKRVLSENTLLQSQVAALQKNLAASESKRQDVVASLQSSQSRVRESQKALRDAETVVSRQSKQISFAQEHSELMLQDQAQQLKRKHQVSFAFLIALEFVLI